MTDVSDIAVLSLDEARTAVLNTSSQDKDDQLAPLVDAVSVRLDELCGPIVIRTVTDELHAGCRPSFTTYKRPIDTITSIIEAWGATTYTLTAETWGTAPTYGYRFDPATQIISRRDGGYTTQFANEIKITYEAGRAADTAAAPSKFKEAAKIILAHIWRNEHGSGNPTFGGDSEVSFGTSFSIPKRALEILGNDLRAPAVA